MSISNTDKVIDSRSVIDRIKELEEELETWKEANPEEEEDDWEDIDELNDLKGLEEDVNSSEWQDGLTLIHESHWEDYVRELLTDIGDVPKNLPHYLVIDWEATAFNIAGDYSTAEFDGETFYYRDC